MLNSVLNVNVCFPRLPITSTFTLLKKVDLRFGEEAFVLLNLLSLLLLCNNIQLAISLVFKSRVGRILIDRIVPCNFYIVLFTLF